jgi:diguanylate cyclase (GGDEF)-like protein
MSKQLEALNAGADDFLLKPVKYRFLYYSLSSRIRRARLLRGFMERDGLTGLLNHTAFQERFSAAFSRAKETDKPLSLALIDIDNFKAINEDYGHLEGDRLLKSLAILLERHLREFEQAILGRVGGEELAILMPDTDQETMKQLLEAIREHYAHIHHETASGILNSTFSCGFASTPDFTGAGALYEAADHALHEAKINGKNRIHGGKPSTKPQQSEQLEDSDILAEEDLIFLEDDPKAQPLVKPNTQPDAPENDKIKVVVVDDDTQMLRHIATVLGEKGFEVITAPTGDQGYDLVKKHHPRLVLIDLLLFPGIHGFELCQKIRKDKSLEGCGIILMTAVYKDYRYRLEGKEAGADDFIEKPINYPVLFDKIKALLPDAGL